MDTIQKLDAYLSSDKSPGNCLGISDLDGFLTGLVCITDDISEPIWMEACLGDHELVEAEVKALVFKRLDEIRTTLNRNSVPIEPVFWHSEDGTTIAMDWCEGFMKAVALAPEGLNEAIKEKECAELLLPILVHMRDGHGNFMIKLAEGDYEAAMHAATESIPGVIPALHALFRSAQK
ncbi:MAG: UPF0149 family protein [Pseudomonadota bacterium]